MGAASSLRALERKYKSLECSRRDSPTILVSNQKIKPEQNELSGVVAKPHKASTTIDTPYIKENPQKRQRSIFMSSDTLSRNMSHAILKELSLKDIKRARLSTNLEAGSDGQKICSTLTGVKHKNSFPANGTSSAFVNIGELYMAQVSDPPLLRLKQG